MHLTTILLGSLQYSESTALSVTVPGPLGVIHLPACCCVKGWIWDTKTRRQTGSKAQDKEH